MSKIIKCEKVSNKGTLDLSIFDKSKYSDGEMISDNNYRLKEEVIKEAIEIAEQKKKELLDEAYSKVDIIEKEAYEKGYDQGHKNGYEDGYKESYNEYVQKAKDEGEFIKNNVDNMLLNANKQIVEYMKDKEKEIVEIAINMASSVLKRHFDDEKSMSELLKNIIEDYNGNHSFIVKCNSFYKQNLEEEVALLKKEISLKADVFIIADDSIEKGNAIIQKDNGKIIVGIDCAIKKLKEELLGE